MNAFDFDKTIYDGDSTLDFYFYSIRKHPIVLLCIPRQIWGAIKYKLKLLDKTGFKQEFYCFFRKIPDINADVIEFWDINESKIKDWYRRIHQDGDLIISASPYFLLEEVCKRLNINNLIASNVDKTTGVYSGKNCYGEEKVLRLKADFKQIEIECFYSDSKSDQPMADMAGRAYLVDGDIIKPW